jgi:hypothetical protein
MLTVLEQVRDAAVDRSVPIEDVLRRCLVLAYELDHSGLQDWLDKELNGYPDDDRDNVPDYRRTRGVIHANFLHVYGHQIPNAQVPVSSIPEAYRELFEETRLVQPIGVYEPLIQGAKNSVITVIPPEIARRIKLYQDFSCTNAWIEIPVSVAKGLLESVRNKVLRFVLEIRKTNPDAGQPKADPVPPERVQQVFNQTIHVHSGTIGNIGSGAGFSQSATVDVVPNDFGSLERFLISQGLEVRSIHELKAAIEGDSQEGHGKIGPRVRGWLKALRESGQIVIADLAWKGILTFAGLPTG